jgi:hypothetical protein
MRKKMDSEQDAQVLVFFLKVIIERQREFNAETHHSYEEEYGSSGL